MSILDEHFDQDGRPLASKVDQFIDNLQFLQELAAQLSATIDHEIIHALLLKSKKWLEREMGQLSICSDRALMEFQATLNGLYYVIIPAIGFSRDSSEEYQSFLLETNLFFWNGVIRLICQDDRFLSLFDPIWNLAKEMHSNMLDYGFFSRFNDLIMIILDASSVQHGVLVHFLTLLTDCVSILVVAGSEVCISSLGRLVSAILLSADFSMTDMTPIGILFSFGAEFQKKVALSDEAIANFVSRISVEKFDAVLPNVHLLMTGTKNTEAHTLLPAVINRSIADLLASEFDSLHQFREALCVLFNFTEYLSFTLFQQLVSNDLFFSDWEGYSLINRNECVPVALQFLRNLLDADLSAAILASPPDIFRSDTIIRSFEGNTENHRWLLVLAAAASHVQDEHIMEPLLSKLSGAFCQSALLFLAAFAAIGDFSVLSANTSALIADLLLDRWLSDDHFPPMLNVLSFITLKFADSGTTLDINSILTTLSVNIFTKETYTLELLWDLYFYLIEKNFQPVSALLTTEIVDSLLDLLQREETPLSVLAHICVTIHKLPDPMINPEQFTQTVSRITQQLTTELQKPNFGSINTTDAYNFHNLIESQTMACDQSIFDRLASLIFNKSFQSLMLGEKQKAFTVVTPAFHYESVIGSEWKIHHTRRFNVAHIVLTMSGTVFQNMSLTIDDDLWFSMMMISSACRNSPALEQCMNVYSHAPGIKEKLARTLLGPPPPFH